MLMARKAMSSMILELDGLGLKLGCSVHTHANVSVILPSVMQLLCIAESSSNSTPVYKDY